MCCGWYPARSAGYAAFFARLSRLGCSPLRRLRQPLRGFDLRLRLRRPGPAGRDAPYGLPPAPPRPGHQMGRTAHAPGRGGDRMLAKGRRRGKQMTRLGHAPSLPFSCGDLIWERHLTTDGPMARTEDGTDPSSDAGLAPGEAVQIEAQTLVLECVIRDTSNTVCQRRPGLGRRVRPMRPAPSLGMVVLLTGGSLPWCWGRPGGVVDGWLLALVLGPPHSEGCLVV